MKPLGYSGQCGRQCGVQFMVNMGHVIIGNMFPDGFSVVSCQDQRNPKPVACVPAPFNIWNIHLLGHEDLLMVINAKHMFAAEGFQVEARHYECTLGKKVGRAAKMLSKSRNLTTGSAILDISNPAELRQIGFVDAEGGGIHRLLYVGGWWATASGPLAGSIMTSLPPPTWGTQPTPRKPTLLVTGHERRGVRRVVRRLARKDLHHAVVHGDAANDAWHDGDLVITGVSGL